MPKESHQVVAGIIVIMIVLLIAVGFIFILITYANKRKKAFSEEKQKLQLLFNEQLLKAKLETQEQTLQHLSTELHDNIGALASLIKINLITIPQAGIHEAAAKINDTTDLTRQLIADIKSLSVSLSNDRIARKGLYNCIATEVERINKTGRCLAKLDLGTTLPDVDSDKTTILFRMVQEILNNAIKHSHAKNITVTVSSTNNMLTLNITDNGSGFHVAEKMQHSDGAGLFNLQKRASMIGGSFSITSHPGIGTSALIELPC